MISMSKKKLVLLVYLPPDLKLWIRKTAHMESRTMSSFVERLVEAARKEGAK